MSNLPPLMLDETPRVTKEVAEEVLRIFPVGHDLRQKPNGTGDTTLDLSSPRYQNQKQPFDIGLVNPPFGFSSDPSMDFKSRDWDLVDPDPDAITQREDQTVGMESRLTPGAKDPTFRSHAAISQPTEEFLSDVCTADSPCTLPHAEAMESKVGCGNGWRGHDGTSECDLAKYSASDYDEATVFVTPTDDDAGINHPNRKRAGDHRWQSSQFRGPRRKISQEEALRLKNRFEQAATTGRQARLLYFILKGENKGKARKATLREIIKSVASKRYMGKNKLLRPWGIGCLIKSNDPSNWGRASQQLHPPACGIVRGLSRLDGNDSTGKRVTTALPTGWSDLVTGIELMLSGFQIWNAAQPLNVSRAQVQALRNALQAVNDQLRLLQLLPNDEALNHNSQAEESRCRPH